VLIYIIIAMILNVYSVRRDEACLERLEEAGHWPLYIFVELAAS
jgi:hypothetical protein